MKSSSIDTRDFQALLDSKISVPERFQSLRILDLFPSVRLENVLRSMEIDTLRNLHGLTYADIFRTRNCGKTTVLELYTRLSPILYGANEQPKPEPVADQNETYHFSVPNYLIDVPLKVFVEGDDNRSVIRKMGVLVLGDLQHISEESAALLSRHPDVIKYLKRLVDRAAEGEFDHLITNSQPQEFRKLLVRYLRRPITIPSQLANRAVHAVSVSTRLANLLRELQVEVFADLQEVSFEDLKSMEGCGIDTVFELWKCLADIARKMKRSDEAEAGVDSELYARGELPDLLDFFNKFILGLSDRHREVFMDRFGSSDTHPLMTLEEVGTKLNITRERVRQIESKHLKKLTGLISARYGDVVDKLIHDSYSNVCPLTPRFLVFLAENRYEVFHHAPTFYLRILREIYPNLPYYDEMRGMSPALGKDGILIAEEIKRVLDEEENFVPISELLERISTRMVIENQGMNLFFDALTHKQIETAEGDSPEVLLARLRKTTLTNTEIARKVLMSAEDPLVPEEILKRAVEIYGCEIDLPSPNSLANLPGYDDDFYLLGRRTIGLRRHFRLCEEKWPVAQNDCYQCLVGAYRPLSTSDILRSKEFEWMSETNPHELAAILRMDIRFVDLGRLLFSLAEWGIKERRSIRDLVVQVLVEASTPLTMSQIAKRIKRFRSVSETSMPATLRNHPDVRDFGHGYYGLKSGVDYKSFFCLERRFVNRVISKAAPCSFMHLCTIMDISGDRHRHDLLRSTLEDLPKVRLSGSGDDSLVTFHPSARK